MKTRTVRATSPRRGAALAGVAVLAALGWGALPAAANAGEAGTVAAVEGAAEIGRGDTFEATAAGAPVHVGDVLRTGEPGRMRVVFQDDSVLNLGDNTTVNVDEQTFQKSEGIFRSTMKLVRGRVRALVSEYYETPGASYELETTAAVAGVRGTEFVVTYDPADETMHVVGIEGRVEVYSSRQKIAHSVFVTSGEVTTASPEEQPAAPRRLEPQDRLRYLEGLDVVALGGGGLGTANSLVQQRAVPAPDRAPGAAGPSGKTYEPPQPRDVGSLLEQPPSAVENTAGGARVGF